MMLLHPLDATNLIQNPKSLTFFSLTLFLLYLFTHSPSVLFGWFFLSYSSLSSFHLSHAFSLSVSFSVPLHSLDRLCNSFCCRQMKKNIASFKVMTTNLKKCSFENDPICKHCRWGQKI